MSVGILLVTHPGVGESLLGVATRLFGPPPLQAECVEVGYDADLDALLPQASAALRRVDGGEGVLLLTDLFGATPSNFAQRIGQLGTPTRRVAGLSLPMLMRVFNYPDRDLAGIADSAAAGARLGVVGDHG
ncbi:MAG: PTS sugar transporter subunit IIA [Lysobacteraceae bacterium]|jgi:PTS system ascorbate-specific IIA component